MARIGFWLQTKRIPAPRASSEIDSCLRSGGDARTNRMPATEARRKRTTADSATGTPCPVDEETNNPPTTGPTIRAIWKAVLFQVTALANCWGGTTQGSRAVRDGAARASPTPLHTSNT